MKNARFGLLAVIALCVGLPACLVPPFSSLQDARMVGAGHTEVTPFYSSIGSSSEGQSQHLQDDIGLQALVGVAKWLDLGFRYEYLHHPSSGSQYDESVDAHVVAAGPKFSLIKDYLALCLPVGFAFGSNVDSASTWEFQPTLLLTIPAAKHFDINLSGKALIPLEKGAETYYAANLGFGFQPDGGAMIIRPEAGILFHPGDPGIDFQFSLGLSFRFGKKADM